MEKKLYPLKFVPIASKKPWGGTWLVDKLGKSYTETDAEGNEQAIPKNERIGESWEVADMGEQDSVVAEGWLAGNSISELMETYMERLVGDKVFDAYGTQFPLLIKFLDVQDKLSVQVHPDDTVASQRYDSLGKAEMWYIIDAAEDATMYMGFKKDVSAREFYDACKSGTADKLLNVIHPKKGDVYYINPGTVHAADKGILVCEIQESSDITFRLYDWGRELNPATARKTHLDEAIELIDYKTYTPAGMHAGPKETKVVCDVPQFTVSHVSVDAPVVVSPEKLESFIVYNCLKGEVIIRMPDEYGKDMDYRLRLGETMLIPAECPDFTILPAGGDAELLQSITRPAPAADSYLS